MNRIEIDHITFGYDESPLFQNLSAEIADGEFCALMGPNGSGKTTLLKCICGLLSFSSGDIRVNGKSIRDYETVELAKLVSYVPQRQDNVFDITVYDLVMMGLYPYQKKWQLPTMEDDAVVCEMLKRCNLTHLRSRLLRELSGGELQRSLIARAMAQQTPIMLLDEPLSNLDVSHRYEIMDILAGLNRQGVMVVIIMHDFPIAIEYATHALLVKDGVVLQHDVRDAVLTPENIRNCFNLGDGFEILANGHISKRRI
ncbi:MAG: ABC transporter ATP-binding protein [Bacteroidales bacterium]|nr:ABC transporter ATP-binding protein [Bacteroidales bacterium]